MKPGRNIAVLTRAVYLGSAFALLFFLAASAPHRVHHFFETALPPPQVVHNHHDDHNAAHTHEHEHDHKRKPAPAEPDCVVLTAAQQSHAAATQCFEIKLVETAVAHKDGAAIVSIAHYHPSPRSQRAPPLA